MFVISWTDRDGPHQSKIQGRIHLLGRALGSDSRIVDMSVSRQHAVIECEDDSARIRDLGSQNGLRVNGQFVKEHRISDGDTIHVGDVPVRFVRLAYESLALENVRRDVSGTIPEGSIVLNVAELTEPESGAVMVSAGGSGEMLCALANVAQELIGYESLDDLLRRIIGLIFQHIPVEDAFLLLYDEQMDELLPKVASNRQGGKPRTRISRQIALAVFNGRSSVLTLDAREDPRFADGQSILTQCIRSVMCVPLWVRGNALGVIFVDSITRMVELEEAHLHFLTLIANVAAAHIEQARLQQQVQEETALKERLMRYQSPTLVDQLITAGEGTLMLEPSEREVTVLFADMVGFSTRTENMAPKDVARLLNRFFSRAVDVIFSFEGTLDKFMGDAVMAFFGAPHDQPDHAWRAVRAAMGMQACLDELNQEEATGQADIAVRIGINTGLAVSGDIGSDRRMEYTVLGNTVNVASRLESSVAAPGEIVIGPETFECVKDKVETEELGPKQLKGIQGTVMTYRILR